MAVVSVDLAYKVYADIGAVVLQEDAARIRCEPLQITGDSDPDPVHLARFLHSYCVGVGIRVMLLDGPQGWKASNNGLIHSRVCERELNTPAKTGLPGFVKPGSYRQYVEFSIAVFNALGELGWGHLSSTGVSPDQQSRIALESFPLSAWRALGIKPLPAKKRAKLPDLTERAFALTHLAGLEIFENPTHDQLQAIVAGLAGLAFERDELDRLAIAGIPPSVEGAHWREGFIVNATRSSLGLPI